MPPDLRRLTGDGAGRFVADAAGQAGLATLTAAADGASWGGRSVLVAVHSQRDAVRALLALDGVARRIVLAPPDLTPAHRALVMQQAGIDAVVEDGTALAAGRPAIPAETEWVLFTSGTTGLPKLVPHTLGSLLGPAGAAPGAVWSTFYDIRRYGGLQILLRALAGGGSMVLSDPAEPAAAFLARAGAVTHISGTPSHWRRALMSGQAGLISPAYVRLSGEIADQILLDRLQQAFPGAAVAHAFASTEAGVAFDVTDGRAGFPAAWVGDDTREAALRVVDGTLRIRGRRTSGAYIGGAALRDGDGFVDTGDIVERDGDRYLFRGRAGGVINVGGQKVHPEEIEAALQAHPAVQAARVRPRANPITGAVVMAEIVVDAPEPDPSAAILAFCRATLPPHKVPALLRIVPSLDVSAAGKLSRA